MSAMAASTPPTAHDLRAADDLRMEVNVPLKRYTVYVTPKGGRGVRLANNYAFGTEQPGVTRLHHWVLKRRSARAGRTVLS